MSDYDPDHYPYRDRFYRTITLQMTMMRMMFWPVVIVMVIVFLGPIAKDFLNLYKDRLELENQGYKVIPDLEEKVDNINSILENITTDNIAARLDIIETAIRIGDVSTEELATIQIIRQDLDQIKSLISSDTARIIEIRALI